MKKELKPEFKENKHLQELIGEYRTIQIDIKNYESYITTAQKRKIAIMVVLEPFSQDVPE